MCFYECDWQVFRNAAPKPHLKRFPPGLKDHFWMWTTARCWITPRGGERARAADTIETKPADAHTSSHSTGALLLFDINYNVCFVLCPTLRTHTGVRRCMHMEIACLHTRILKHTLKYTHTHTPRGVRLSLWNSPSHNSEETGLFPNVPLPTRNDSISPLADCTYDTFSSYFVKQAHSALTFQHRRHASLFMLNHNASGIKDQLRNM